MIDFRWGWKYEWERSIVPKEMKWNEKEGIFISQPFVTNHIYHFSESVNQLLLKLLDRSMYPHINELYLPNFRKENEFEWSKTYLKLLIELYPEESRFSVRFHDNMNRNEYECFRSCVMND